VQCKYEIARERERERESERERERERLVASEIMDCLKRTETLRASVDSFIVTSRWMVFAIDSRGSARRGDRTLDSTHPRIPVLLHQLL
jgi:hypothetical protein